MSFPGVFDGQQAAIGVDGIPNPSTPAYLQQPWVKPDVTVFYSFLAVLGLFGALNHYVWIRDWLRTPVISAHKMFQWRTTYGELAILLLFLAVNVYWYFYFISWKEYADLSDQYGKTVGHFNDLWCALAILPVSRHGIWEIILDRSYDENLKYHRWLGYGAFFWISMHFGIWNISRLVTGTWLYKFWQEGMDLQFSKVPGETNRKCTLQEVIFCQCGDGHNVYIPPLWCIYWIFALSVAYSFYRRTHYEIFKLLHWVFAPMIFFAFFHSWNFWHIALPGVLLWFFNRAVSRSKASTELIIGPETCTPQSGVTILSLERRDGLFPGHSAAQFMSLNIPEIDPFEWHPITISSSPIDDRGNFCPRWTHHIRDMGSDQWSGKLLTLVASAKPFTVRYDGPFGTPPRYLERAAQSNIHTLILVLGGIGCTPMMSMLAEMHALLTCKGSAVLGSLTLIKVIWSARNPAFFELFGPTMSGLEKVAPGKFEFLLHTSRTTRRQTTTLIEPVKVRKASLRESLTNNKFNTHDEEFRATSTNDTSELRTNSSGLKVINARCNVAQVISSSSEQAGRQKIAVFACGPAEMVNEASNACFELQKQGFPVEFDDTEFLF
jgi:hypothetical protein